MYYVYLLKSSKTNKFYIGYSKDLRKRFSAHNDGLVKSTKSGLPWELMYYEAYSSAKAAQTREKRLKHYGKALAMLKKRVLVDDN
jgi:putative endonuclease